jgi:hypothetical protein
LAGERRERREHDEHDHDARAEREPEREHAPARRLAARTSTLIDSTGNTHGITLSKMPATNAKNSHTPRLRFVAVSRAS